MSGVENIARWYTRADDTDKREGALAYPRYHRVMQGLADKYGVTVEQATAVFVSLSPNNDYMGNLRSAASVLAAYRDDIPKDSVVISTYRHCMDRAWEYVRGRDFAAHTKGLKVLSFYNNIIRPEDPEWVTIDGHMYAIWLDKPLTMKEAIVKSRREYFEVRNSIRALSTVLGVVPCGLQAVLWFTRKRVLNIKYNANVSMFGDPTDLWNTWVDPDVIKPYPITSKRVTVQGHQIESALPCPPDLFAGLAASTIAQKNVKSRTHKLPK